MMWPAKVVLVQRKLHETYHLTQPMKHIDTDTDIQHKHEDTYNL